MRDVREIGRANWLVFVGPDGSGTMLQGSEGIATEILEELGGGEPEEFELNINTIVRPGLYVYSCDIDGEFEKVPGAPGSHRVSWTAENKDLKLATEADMIQYFGYPASRGECVLVGGKFER